ncbi:glycerophosphodiester phosphodiesterase family protein [Rhizobium sp. RU36D]|uniref:glycerophosphodiester phosphodiesterase family protein n=1 Tax=Rhizobium sp. RU36D TaxID=1907415 RepID=UPI0009D85649|nr:glycerophosphodiester phosphodiesterase family protein [Rhizobium sp. RU36D]SMC63988.1 glycerophosphoryl diester phosphodiesterase [Rhizobium sp. RU36D]
MQRFFFGLALVIAAVWAMNTSLFRSFPDGGAARVIAHRGQHQTFDRADLDNDTCTAERIHPPEHAFLENTLPSMEAAFAAGADVVELDVHLTPDGQFAVFHDWTLDCRTDGEGVTEKTPMSVLRTLDIGYGYTADDGKTFPFSGKGVGMMPTLDEVFARFPDRKFLINFKSRRTEEGTELARQLLADPRKRAAVYGVYGGTEPTETVIASVDGMLGYSRSSVTSCLLTYLALGWSGHVPDSCAGRLVPVPQNFAFLLWGWPHRFVERMASAGSEVILVGPFTAGDPGTAGLDEVETWANIPQSFPGLIWTNRIERAAEFARASGYCQGRQPSGICAP